MKIFDYIDKKVPCQKGKTFIVTGATSGIGLEVSRQLLFKHANLVMACRNIKKAEETKAQLLKEFPNASIEILSYDQANFESIEEFAKTIENRKIDALVLNAGIFHPTNNLTTVDGYPLTIGTNYLGAYYLLEKLENSFKNGSIKRVVVTYSLINVFGKTKHYEKYLLNIKKKPNRTYNISKRMNYHLAGNLKVKHPELEVVLTHPGIARTNIIKSDSSSFRWWFKVAGDRFLKIFGNSAKKSAICTLFAATLPFDKPLPAVYPRGPFHYIGLPKITSKNPQKIKNEQLALISKKIISN